MKRTIEKYKNVTYHVGDVFDEDIQDKIHQLIYENNKVLFFCDNGNKIEEFNLYAPYLKKGDIIFVHDWGNEIDLQDIIYTIDEEKLTPYLHKLSEKHNSLLRGWTK